MNALGGGAGEPIVTQRIVYRTLGENKQNGDALEEELRNKDELLKIQQ